MSRKHWNMLVPTPAAFSEQFSAYAIAYLDSAQRLCDLLARSHRKATYERGAVVLFLAAHAVELFLKGAIVRKAPKERFSHDLEHLIRRYRALYPGKKFQLEVPFSTALPPEMTAEEKRRLKEHIAAPGELYRYPIDKAYKPWSGAYGIEPNSLSVELTKLRSRLDELRSAYES
jgi:HEPN domain-containing protein